MRDHLTPLQKQLLNTIWQNFRTKGEWPKLRVLYSAFDKSKTKQALSTLGGSFVYEQLSGEWETRCALLLPGVVLTDDGTSYMRLLAQFFQFQRAIFKSDPARTQITSSEIQAALTLSEDQVATLGELVFLGSFFGASGGKGPRATDWTVGPMKEAEDFPDSGDFIAVVENHIMRDFVQGKTVFVDDRIQAPPVSESPNARERLGHLEDVHPLSRRYQVFVSSTYTDLIEERKQVIQALLTTKCIPAGMELFPAANASQWDLIKRVIDDCDYYILILAGKYGSLGPAGISYTEMEYDYAVAVGKSVLVFFHADLGKLIGEKLELVDPEKREKLMRFTAKAKSNRICQSWTTAEGLGSAIKTALLHAIETDPKPGWIRANTVPSWRMVESLRERISELETSSKPKRSQPEGPNGADWLEIPILVSWVDTGKPDNRLNESFQTTKQIRWDDTLCHLHLSAGEKNSRLGLLRRFANSVAATFKDDVIRQSTGTPTRVAGQIDGDVFEQVLNTLVARKLLVTTGAPKHVKSKGPYFQLTREGTQRLAEINANKNKNKLRPMSPPPRMGWLV
jgi:hypothetical protein